MGFSSGASSAKRAAKKAAAAEYYKAFAKLNSIPELKRISSSNKRDVEDALGDSASFRTRNLSQKSDRLARKINKDDQYKDAINSYNDRYSILKDQIANKSSTRYTLANTPGDYIQENKRGSGTTGSGLSEYVKPSKPGNLGMADIASMGSKNKMPHSAFITQDRKNSRKDRPSESQTKIYATKEEAMADAIKKMEKYNNSINGLMGKDKPRNQTQGMLGDIAIAPGKYSQKEIDAMKQSDASRFIKEEKFNGFDVLYRNLDLAESAANDITGLSKRISDSEGNKNVTDYSALAEKLKPLIKRDARNIQSGANNGKSLVSNELASATPYLETV